MASAEHVLEAVTLEELRAQLEKQYGFLKEQPYRFAVNEEIVTDMQLSLKPSDHIALLPPFSGG